MPPVNPAENLLHAPFADLVVLLLKQFKRLLAEHDINLTTEDMERLGQAAADYAPLPDETAAIQTALRGMVNESLALLRERFHLTFAQSLASDMNEIGGWQTTAEFLDIANQKSNAELRISAGSTLLVMLGDTPYAEVLLAVIDYDNGTNDVDAAFAQRALLHLTRVPADAPDWLEQVRQKLAGF